MKKILLGLLVSTFFIGTAVSAAFVKNGDTFCGLARKFDVPCSELKQSNPRQNYDKIYPGEEINTENLGGTVSKPYTFSPSTVIQSSQINSDYDTLYNLVNGSIDNNNIASNAGITATKISGTSVVTTPTSTQTITNAGTTYSTVIKGVSQQSASIFDVQNSNGHSVLSVSSTIGTNVSTTLFFNDSTYKIYRDGSDMKFTDPGSGTTYTLTQLGTATSFNEGDAIDISASTINVVVSSTSGMATSTSNSLYQKINTDTGLEYGTGSVGLHINTSTLIGVIATSTPTASKIPIAGSDGKLNSGWGRFGGTGADGALSIGAGTTTTLDLVSTTTTVKNYTSINIPATAGMEFSNPTNSGSFVVLRSTGDCTIAGGISVTSTGAVGGDAVTSASSAVGLSGNDGASNNLARSEGGTAGAAASNTGVAGAVPTFLYNFDSASKFLYKYPSIVVGAGGSSGTVVVTANSGTSGKGGRGAGGLIIECAGSLTFSGKIYAQGENGGTGTSVGAGAKTGGGGGGGGGSIIIFYNTLTSNTGTITTTGGTGGNSSSEGSGNNHYGGAGGGSVNAGNAGTASLSDGTKTGGDGGAGFSLITQNTEWF